MKYVDYDILVINRKHYSFVSLQSMFLWLGGIMDHMIPLAKSDLMKFRKSYTCLKSAFDSM